jgi:hypothetical protein
MNSSPTLTRSCGIRVAIAAALSTVIGIGILAAVTDLFQSRGEPLGQLAAAERACAGRAYVSEREACMREWIAALQSHRAAR